MKNIKILIVDDESRMRKLIKDFLIIKGFLIFEAENGQKALDIFEATPNVNLIILDVMMPILDGWSTLREIRKLSQVPVIMLTARGEERDELFGFELGVDEYISKPFSPKILVARIESLLKRCYPNLDNVKDYNGVIIDTDAHSVCINGNNIDLSMKEFELLQYLTDNQNIALSREKILNNVWNYDYFGDSRTIDSHIKKLRKKLGKKGSYIQTIRGLGYKFEIK
jgi:DNA-binding response OmpR family regulator